MMLLTLDPPDKTLWSRTDPPGIKGTVTLDGKPWPAVHGDDGYVWIFAAKAVWHTASAYSTIESFKADR